MSEHLRIVRREVRPPQPARIVALGGGTGMPAVLRGLKAIATRSDRRALTAVVTMSDDGGSSGRLRKSMGLPPPGDVRKCLVALSESESLLAGLFEHRYGDSPEIGGHSLGNLILAALAEQTGCFLKAVEMSSDVLRTVGRILPSTQVDVTLVAHLDDNSCVRGETAIAACGRRIRRVRLDPDRPAPTAGVIESILEADLVVIGPGSLYTSILPNVVIGGVGEALVATGAQVVLVANLVSERGEASGLDLADHVAVIEEHAGHKILDAVLTNDGPIQPEMLGRYRAEGAVPLTWPTSRSMDIPLFRRNLLAGGPKLRHDPDATARGLLDVWAALREERRVGHTS